MSCSLVVFSFGFMHKKKSNNNNKISSTILWKAKPNTVYAKLAMYFIHQNQRQSKEGLLSQMQKIHDQRDRMRERNQRDIT